MPSLYTFHEPKFSRVQRTKIERSINKIPKCRFSNCFCEKFCTYLVTKYNAQSIVPGITKHFPLVPENLPTTFFFGIWCLCAQSMHSQEQKCTVRYHKCTVMHSNAQSGTKVHSQVQ